MRTAKLDRHLVAISLGLMLFGLLTLYSAGQTDVPTHAAGVWLRQLVWFGVGVVAGWVVAGWEVAWCSDVRSWWSMTTP